MKVDTHVHTFHSGNTSLYPLKYLAVPLVLAAAHFMLEDRFNRSLLFDLVARPAGNAVPR